MGYIYLGPADACVLRQQVVASIVKYRPQPAARRFFGGLMSYDCRRNVAFACPGHQGGQFYRKSPRGQLFFRHFRRDDLPQRSV